MFNEDYKAFFKQVLFRSLGVEVSGLNFTFVGGGCINDTVRLRCSEGDFFLKWNESVPDDMFEKEALGLRMLSATQTISVPAIVNCGNIEGKSFLLLEYLNPGIRTGDYWKVFGHELANLHRHSNDQFGLDYNNYIGRLPQKNDYCKSWVKFFIDCRLRPQVGLALYNRSVPEKLGHQFERFYQKLPQLLPDEPPSLLHGDLWSGNVHTSPQGHACLIDPAVHYGHREMDLAFTKLFGGFDPDFYQSYLESWPLVPGWEDRTEIFNLYPLMVHVNLFGLSYLPAVQRTLERYI